MSKRTVLLKFISNTELRQQITAATNKVEAYHGFVKWLFFGGDSIIASNDPEQQEKSIKYNDLIANAVIFENVVDLTEVLPQLQSEGYLLEREDVACCLIPTSNLLLLSFVTILTFVKITTVFLVFILVGAIESRLKQPS